jgi:hypothetical protein
VVIPVNVITVTVPPFWAPSIVTGPVAVGSWLFPVLPKFSLVFVCSSAPLSDPEPPQALKANSPTAEMAINGVLSLIYARTFR